MSTFSLQRRIAIKSGYINFAWCILIPTITVLILIFSVEQSRHWFLFPLLGCGILSMLDASLWFRKKVDLFDPIGLVGLFGLLFFFLAPLLHVAWDYWMQLVTPPEDWRDWLGRMGIINFVGLIVYRFSRGMIRNKPLKYKRVINYKLIIPLLGVASVVAALLQIWFYRQYGGVFGFFSNHIQSDSGLDGMGMLFTFSESFPMLLTVLILLLIHKKSRKRTIFFVGLLLVSFFALKLYFGGLRGSRNSIVWFLFWSVCLYHNFLRPISKKIIISGVLIITVFMYFYGFYKSGGIESLQSALGGNVSAVEQQTGRTIESVILGDYGRSDVQAILLRTVSTTDYPLAWGMSYVGDVFKLIPPFITDTQIPEKRYYGTQAQFYGQGLPYDGYLSTRLYGLTGEWMINFGYLTTPIAFMILGIFVSKVRNSYVNMDRDDARFFLIPIFVNLCFLSLVNDLDNHLFFIFKNIFFLGLIIYFCSKRIKTIN